MIRLSRLLSDGMILHKDKPCRIWGKAAAGSKITACVADSCAETITEVDGRFELFLNPPTPGGGYKLTVKEYANGTTVSDTAVVWDVAVGLVYIMCGQSNAGFPMSRVRDTYPEEWQSPDEPDVRTFKIIEHPAFDHIEEDVLTGSWENVNPKSIDAWCAVGYFAAKKLRSETGLPVGIIDATYGGSPIAAWMSRDMLSDYPDLLAEADKYCDKAYMDKVNEINSHWGDWRESVASMDPGFKEHWEKSEADGSWKSVTLPAFFTETSIGRVTGTVWLKKKFYIGNASDVSDMPVCENEDITGSDVHLWLGTMNDSDITYVNGVEVGRTEYCYPPRRYTVPAGLLKKGVNEITIRLIVEHGMGRVTSHKLLAFFTGDTKRYIDADDNECVEGAGDLTRLDGEWLYKMGAESSDATGGVFLCYAPTSLYNGVLDPVLKYTVGAFMWYQGESNTGEDRGQYYDLSVKQIEGIREMTGDADLPYILARLPKFGLNEYEGAGNGVGEESLDGWSYIQMIQCRLGELDNVYTVDTKGMGEAYDLHPQDKKPLGEEYAKILYSILKR